MATSSGGRERRGAGGAKRALAPPHAHTYTHAVAVRHYNYIEDLDDGRGYTTTLYGACSGTGDLLMIFDVIKRLDSKHSLLKYYPALSKAEGDDTTGLKGLEKDIPALGRDAVWRQAVWEIYVKLYWAFVEE